VGTFFYFGKLGKVKNKALSLAPMVCVDKKRKKIQKCKIISSQFWRKSHWSKCIDITFEMNKSQINAENFYIYDEVRQFFLAHVHL